MTLLFEQLLNGLQFGAMLFMLAAGLTLIFGIMGVVNLTHGSFYMVGAYCAAYAIGTTGSFLAGVLAALLGAGLYGISVEVVVIRKLYKRDHLYQVLATFGLLLFSNEAVSLIFGRRPPLVGIPSFLEGAVTLAPGFQYPLIRLSFIAIGALVAVGLWWLVNRTRIGMLIRAGADDREMVDALGIDIRKLYTLVFGLGALLCGLAGVMAAPLLAVEIGMGES
jgi:branched-chain amino acid transport system permease protein